MFEIVYADGSVVAGHTRADFDAARNDSVQFVIVQYPDGVIVKHKAQSLYEYKGGVKPGAWTSDENFNDLKRRLPELSTLLSPSAPPRRRNHQPAEQKVKE